MKKPRSPPASAARRRGQLRSLRCVDVRPVVQVSEVRPAGPRRPRVLGHEGYKRSCPARIRRAGGCRRGPVGSGAVHAHGHGSDRQADPPRPLTNCGTLGLALRCAMPRASDRRHRHGAVRHRRPPQAHRQIRAHAAGLDEAAGTRAPRRTNTPSRLHLSSPPLEVTRRRGARRRHRPWFCGRPDRQELLAHASCGFGARPTFIGVTSRSARTLLEADSSASRPALTGAAAGARRPVQPADRARSSWTRSASCRSRCRRNCCARCRSRRSSRSAPTR